MLFQMSTRLGVWDVQLAALEDMCVCFFAYNRLDYAMHIPEYIARMYSLKDTHSDIWQVFCDGGFVVQKGAINFTAIGVDQAQEHINKTHKGDGGIDGITTSPETLLKYCLSTSELSRLSKETEVMLGLVSEAPSEHHDLSHSKLVFEEKLVACLKEVLCKSNPFKVGDNIDGTEHNLVHLTKNIIIKENVQENILTTIECGTSAY